MYAYRFVQLGSSPRNWAHLLRSNIRSKLLNRADQRSLSSKITPTARIEGIDRNVWVEFTAIAATAKVNLGQGFPNFSPPSFLIDALTEAAQQPLLNQYTRGHGHPRLVKALAKMYGQLQGREINPMTEVLTTVGAYSSLFFIFQAFVHPGDELMHPRMYTDVTPAMETGVQLVHIEGPLPATYVIVFEPFFDCYAPMTKMAGAKAVGVPLRWQGKHPGSSRDLSIDPKELADAISPRTKMILINTPHNPTGKVFQRDELEVIAELCQKHDLLCVSDEVYEWLVHDGKHTRTATLPGMWERTLTVGSAGKTFNSTGWKLGWSIGPAHFIKHMATVSSNSCYTIPTLLQEGVAVGLEQEVPLIGKPESFFNKMQQEFFSKRDEMAEVLSVVGFKPIVPESGYFMVADTSPLGVEFESGPGSDSYDYQFVKWLAKEKGLALIPVSAFHTPKHSHLSGKMVRFCFGKTDDVLQEAFALLRSWARDREEDKN